MGMDWTKFDKQVDLDAISDDLKDVEENGGGDFPDIPDGDYEVIVHGMELGQSKVKDDGSGGDPMLKIQFKIVAGEYKGSLIFYNGVMQPAGGWIGLQTHRNNEMLTALNDGEPFKFTSFAQYTKDIEELFEDISVEGDEWHYLLNQKPNKNPQFKDISIKEILD